MTKPNITDIIKSKWRRIGVGVYGLRPFGHNRDKIEDGPIACGSQPPGTYQDHAEQVADFIVESANIAHETGKMPAQLRERVNELEHANKILELKNKSSLANNLCPDHRDKQAGKPCLACDIESLEKRVKRLHVAISMSADKIAYDHPQLEQLDSFQKLWAIEQCCEGSSKANADWHERYKLLTAQRDELLTEIIRRNEAACLCDEKIGTCDACKDTNMRRAAIAKATGAGNESEAVQ